MMNLTRRLFASRAPLAAAGLPSALHQTATSEPAMLGVNAFAHASALDPKWRAFDLARRPHMDRQRHRHQQVSMLGGLDPDLFALRSMPVTQKVRIQAERDRQRQDAETSLFQQLARAAGVEWGD